jgi:hypothetical protein
MPLSKIPSAGFQDNVKFRNIIINGDMSIAQRATSVSSVTSTGYRAVDRFRIAIGSAGTWTISQSTDVPTGQGFAKSMKMDCTTADASLSASDNINVQHLIEGQNLQYLKYGTSSAESLTLSFWVKSNKTGTYTVEFEETGNARHFCKTYTIDSASTWEKKTITISGDTASALANDNTLELRPIWWLGAGSNFTSGTLNTSGWSSQTTANRVSSSNVNLADSTSNEWYITGVQLEAGTTASDFEFLPVDVNLGRCLRYYEKIVSGASAPITVGANYTATDVYSVLTYTVKRTAPSLDQTTGSNYYQHVRRSTTSSFSQFLSNQIFNNRLRLYVTGIGSTTTGTAGWFATINANSYIAVDAEL